MQESLLTKETQKLVEPSLERLRHVSVLSVSKQKWELTLGYQNRHDNHLFFRHLSGECCSPFVFYPFGCYGLRRE
jgi:hypothetical protein